MANCRILKKFNIGIENAKRIYDKLGAMAIETINENPYILIDLVKGVNFKQIDDMALKLGTDMRSLKENYKWYKICFDTNIV